MVLGIPDYMMKILKLESPQEIRITIGSSRPLLETLLEFILQMRKVPRLEIIY